MPYSYVQRPLAGTAPQTVPFPYLAREHVKLFLGYSLISGTFDQLLVQGTQYSWINDFSISIATGLSGTLTILRQTPTDSRLVDWANGSSLTAEPMDTADLQLFYAFQELWDRGIISGIAAAEATAVTSQALLYLPVANVASIPSAPSNGLRVEVTDSTGIEALLVPGMPPGFAGAPGLRVRLRRDGSAWAWEGYAAADPDGRYVERDDVSASLTDGSAVKVLNLAGAKALRDLIYTPVPSKANLPPQPAEGNRFIVLNSTGIEAAPAPAGMPAGFVGEPALRVQLIRGSSGWIWDGYDANDPDDRYVRKTQLTALTATTPSVVTANTTAATAVALSYRKEVLLHLPMETSVLQDVSIYNRQVQLASALNDPALTTVDARFGTASAFFDGYRITGAGATNGAGGLVVSGVEGVVGLGDFCLELDIMRTSTPEQSGTAYNWIYSVDDSCALGFGGGGYYDPGTGNTIQRPRNNLYWASQEGAEKLVGTVPFGAFVSVTIDRKRGILKCFVEGVETFSGADQTSMDLAAGKSIKIGRRGLSGIQFEAGRFLLGQLRLTAASRYRTPPAPGAFIEA